MPNKKSITMGLKNDDNETSLFWHSLSCCGFFYNWNVVKDPHLILNSEGGPIIRQRRRLEEGVGLKVSPFG